MRYLLILALAFSASAQTMIFGGGNTARRVGPQGDTLPATCGIGELFTRTGATAPGIYGCGTANTWTIMQGGEGSYTLPTAAADTLGGIKIGSGLAITDGVASVGTLNQNTTGTAAGLTAQYIDWSAGSGGTSIANKPTLGTAAAATLGTGAGQVPVTGEYQPSDADLAAIAALTCTENQIIKLNGAGAWVCAADATAGSPTFDGVGSGTNTTAAMVVSTGASLSASGTGTIVATSASGNAGTATALAANGANCSAGSYPLGVNASGAVEDCTAAAVGNMVNTGTPAATAIPKYSDTTGTAIAPSGVTIASGDAVGIPGPTTITGDTDAVQLRVTGNATQTNAIMVVEKSDGTDILVVNNDGSVDIGTGGGGWLLTAEVAPDTPAAGKAVLYVDSTTKKLTLKDDAGVVSDTVIDASTTVKGKVELAIGSEVTTGSSATLAVTPDALRGSDYGKKVFMLEVFEDATALATGDGKLYIPVPDEYSGWNIVAVSAHVGSVVSSSGAVDVDIARCAAVATGIRCSGTVADVLSTNLTVDADEDGSETAAAAAVINTSNDDLPAAGHLRIDVDGAGTGTKGLIVRIVVQKP